MRAQLASILFAVGISGCYASGGYSAGYSTGPAPQPVYTNTQTTVSVETYEPDLVDVSPGVQVIADYEEPVFYSDNFYWRYSGDTWYRSSVHTGGWVVYNDVPPRVRTIERPQQYVRYKPQGYTPRHQRVRDNRDYNGGYNQPTVRDHRTGGYDRQPQPQPTYEQPTVRDHRTGGYDRQPQPQPTYQPQPTVRDHRTGGTYQQPQPQPSGTYQQPRPQPSGGSYQQPRPQPSGGGYQQPRPQPTPAPTTNGGGYQQRQPANTGGGYRTGGSQPATNTRDQRKKKTR